MGKIHLKNMEFFAHNGYYEEEQNIGNRYAVDVEIETDFTEAAVNDRLENTINYEQIYRIVNREINRRYKLLEAIVYQINTGISKEFDSVKKVTTTVCKHNPPFGGLCEKVCISDTLVNF